MNTLFKLAFIVAALLLSVPLQATIYTTVASGNYSAASVWQGGVKPPVVLYQDTVVINAGHTITLDNILTVNDVSAYLNVVGTLHATPGSYISFEKHITKVSVPGNITMDSIICKDNITFDVPGRIDIKTLYCWIIQFQGGGVINIEKRLSSGRFTIGANSTLNFKDSVNMEFRGVNALVLSHPSSVLNLPPTYYNITYTGITFPGSKMAGAEVTGVGLNDINVDVAGVTTTHGDISMQYDVTIRTGKLNLVRGHLWLNQKRLVFTGNSDFSSTGGFVGGGTIVINNQSGLTVPLIIGTTDSLVQNTQNGAPTKLNLMYKPVIRNYVGFDNGKIILENGKLTMYSRTMVSGANTDKYFVTSETGVMNVKKSSLLTKDSAWHHIGTPTFYAPVRLLIEENAAIPRTDTVTIYVLDGVRAQLNTGNLLSATEPMVNVTWFFDPPEADLTNGFEFYWSPPMEVNGFDRSNAVNTFFKSNKWNPTEGKTTIATALPGMYGIACNFSTWVLGPSFWPYQRAVFDKRALSIPDLLSGKTIKAFPNPATTVLQVEINSPAKAIVYNVSGQVVATADVGSGSNTINIANLPQGMYYLQLKGETVNGTAKFVKQ